MYYCTACIAASDLLSRAAANLGDVDWSIMDGDSWTGSTTIIEGPSFHGPAGNSRLHCFEDGILQSECMY